MKTKFIVISFAVLVVGAIIFIVTKQEAPYISMPRIQGKVEKITEKKPEQISSQKIESKKEVPAAKAQVLGKMPNPSEKGAMEEFFNKAFMAWNDKVASLIVNDLKLGQEALDKYHKIRDDYYHSQFALFQAHTSNEPKGSEDKDAQRRLASTGKNFKAQLEDDYGINLDSDQLNAKEDFPKIQKAVQDTLKKDSDQFLADHLKQVQGVMGKDGFNKYQKIKEDFNNEITDDGQEALFKI